jgi:beta-mannosidase
MHHTQRLSKSRKFFAKEIYHRILPQLVTEHGAGTPYIPTTPLSEKGSYKEMPTMTTHQWKIWSEHEPVRNYICKPEEIPSFVTEFGLQSMPAITTLKKWCPEKQMNIGTRHIEKHNYQLDGNSRLYRYSADLFGTTDDLELFNYLTQVTQARAAKNYVEYLRTHKPLNNGVLFWQFNDSAPAITWAAIDYYANPKALYYYAKRFFADIVIIVLQEKPDKFKNVTKNLNDLTVIAVNDTSMPLTATLNCRLIDLFGNLIDKVTLPLAVGPHRNSTPVKLPKAFNRPENPNNTCLAVAIENEDKIIAQNIHLYLPDKYINWPKTKIKKQLDQLSQNKWLLKLTSDSVAKDVQLSTCSNAQFSDNFVDLLPNKVHEFTITGENLLHNECKLISYQLR